MIERYARSASLLMFDFLCFYDPWKLNKRKLMTTTKVLIKFIVHDVININENHERDVSLIMHCLLIYFKTFHSYKRADIKKINNIKAEYI